MVKLFLIITLLFVSLGASARPTQDIILDTLKNIEMELDKSSPDQAYLKREKKEFDAALNTYTEQGKVLTDHLKTRVNAMEMNYQQFFNPSKKRGNPKVGENSDDQKKCAEISNLPRGSVRSRPESSSSTATETQIQEH